MAGRTRQQRRLDVLHRIESDANVWVATSSPDGVPHLVPLSLAWDGSRFVLATEARAATAKNIAASGRARLALDSAEDVVIFDTDAEALSLSTAPVELVDLFTRRAGWDPRAEAGDWVLLLLQPTRVQAWNGVNEIEGRTLMKQTAWLD